MIWTFYWPVLVLRPMVRPLQEAGASVQRGLPAAAWHTSQGGKDWCHPLLWGGSALPDQGLSHHQVVSLSVCCGCRCGCMSLCVVGAGVGVWVCLCVVGAGVGVWVCLCVVGAGVGVSLAGAATSIICVTTKVLSWQMCVVMAKYVFWCDKSMLVMTKLLLRQKDFVTTKHLSWQFFFNESRTNICRDKNLLWRTHACCDKHNFVSTKLLLQEAYFCRNKRHVLSWCGSTSSDQGLSQVVGVDTSVGVNIIIHSFYI